MVRRK